MKNTLQPPSDMHHYSELLFQKEKHSSVPTRTGQSTASIAAALLLVFPLSGFSATVAWWRFEETDTRPTEVTLSPIYNSPILNATLDSSVSSIALSNWVSNSYISDGEGGSLYANTQSLKGLASGQAAFRNQLNNGDATGLLNDIFVNNGAAWTFEVFIYLPSDISGDYGMIFGNGNAFGDGFNLDLSAANNTPRFFSGKVASGFVSGPSLSSDQWHHLALTATPDGSGAWTLSMYIDHSLVNSVGNYQLNTNTGHYGIAAPNNAFAGYLDEVRISDVALTPEQMLRAVPVPESSSLILTGVAGALMALVKFNRKNWRANSFQS